MKQYNKKDIKKVNTEIECFDLHIDSKQNVYEKNNVVFVDNFPLLLKIDERFIPTLKSNLNNLKNVYVDTGAIPFVVKGADVMRPGISNYDEFAKDEVVAVRDASHKKALAIGIALNSSDELKTIEKGKVIKVVHFVGDDVWNLES